MDSRAKLLGHPVHPMLIVVPAGLWLVSFIFDVIYVANGNSAFSQAAYLMIGAGIVGAALAAVFGLIDYTKIPSGTRAKAIGTYHALTNVVVLLLFAFSFWLRVATPAAPPNLAVVVSGVAVGLLLVSAWLGGELVDRLGVGVDDGANLNAPNSLRKGGTRAGGFTVHPG